MARDFAVNFYHSKSWTTTRNAYMNTYVKTPLGVCPPGMCERCFEAGILKPAEIIHHKVHLNPENINDPSITINFENLKRVCRECHGLEHSQYAETPLVRFDENGRVMSRG